MGAMESSRNNPSAVMSSKCDAPEANNSLINDLGRLDPKQPAIRISSTPFHFAL